MPAAIAFEDVSKHYRGAREYRALRDDIVGAAGRIVGIKRPPRLAVRALDRVTFEVPQGQSFGLIGLNGAGKTTALKIATRVAYPSSGRMRVRGRVGALIEVGTGMHPELTGRENLQLYGRILGLSRKDIARRFEEIVDFAGLGPAIEQPVKQYSSGMQLRLGFSIAAHLEPDVLLVDEALAVGDAGFQYRCVERMSKLVNEGRTLVLVSHDMSAIEALCTRAILLRNGTIAADGAARDVVREYLESARRDRLATVETGAAATDGFQIRATTLHDRDGNEVDAIESGQPVTVRLHFNAPEPVRGPIVNVGIADGNIGPITLASMLRDGGAPEVVFGLGSIDCTFEALPLWPRDYEIWCGVRGELGYGNLVAWHRARFFTVTGTPSEGGKAAAAVGAMTAPVKIPYRWQVRSDA